MAHTNNPEVERYSAAVIANPQDAAAYAQLAQALVAGGALDEAICALEAAYALDREHWFALAEAYDRRSDHERALGLWCERLDYLLAQAEDDGRKDNRLTPFAIRAKCRAKLERLQQTLRAERELGRVQAALATCKLAVYLWNTAFTLTEECPATLATRDSPKSEVLPPLEFK
jgi:tetratricopeptide (TPR) repeat protein